MQEMSVSELLNKMKKRERENFFLKKKNGRKYTYTSLMYITSKIIVYYVVEIWQRNRFEVLLGSLAPTSFVEM